MKEAGERGDVWMEAEVRERLEEATAALEAGGQAA